MKTLVNKKKQLVGLLYGLAAGLAFAVFAWGIDAFLIANAHGAYSWVKFIPGLLISTLCGGFVGWITVRFQNHFLGIGIWLAYALILSKLIVWLPIQLTPYLIKIFNSPLGNYLDYPVYKELNQIRWFGFVVIAIVSIVCALIENILIDQAFFSTGKIAIFIPVIVCALCFSLAGNSADGLYNRVIREPILIVDNLLQFAADNLDKEVPPTTVRAMHLSAVNTIKEYLPRERTLILSNFDQSFGQIDVLINFSGYWVKCTTVYNQVTFCKEALETTNNLFSHFYVSEVISFDKHLIDPS